MSGSGSGSGALDLTNLHTDIYVVEDVNPGGKKFDKVNRLVCKGQDSQTNLIIDIASVEYSLNKGDRFKMCLSGTLRIDGKPDEDVYNQDGKVRALAREEAPTYLVFSLWPAHINTNSLAHTHTTPTSALAPTQRAQPSLLDSYEYGMCGRIFRHDSLEGNIVSVITSFGGLLMQLKGEMRHLIKLRMDSKIYALIKKVAK